MNNKKRLIPFLISNLIVITICLVLFVILLSMTFSLFMFKNGSSFPKTMFVPHLSLLLFFLVSQLLSLVIEIKTLKRKESFELFCHCANKLCLISIISSTVLLLACFFYVLLFLLDKSFLSIRVTSLFDLSIIVVLTFVLLVYPVISFVVFLRNSKLQQDNS